MKKNMPFFLCFVCIAVFCSMSFAETINRIIAFVNDDIVTEGDLRFFMSSLSGGKQIKDSRDVINDAIEHLIDQRLIIQEAKKSGIAIDPQEVSKTLDRIKASASSKEEYELMLKGAGITEEQLKNKLRDQLLAQRAIDVFVRSSVVISPTDIARVSSEYSSEASDSQVASQSSGVESGIGQNESKVYHILIRIKDDRPEAEALRLSDELYQKLVKGEGFEDIARRYSEDSYASSGGFMGWVKDGELLPKLDEVASKLSEGEISQPILTPIGAHIIKISQRRTKGDIKSQENDKKRIAQMKLYQEKFARAMDEWITELRDRAYIEFVYE